MRVVLSILEKGRLRREEFIAGSDSLPVVTVTVSAMVSAELLTDESDEHGLYMLQVGSQPDIRVDASLQFGSSSCKFKLHKYDSDLKQEVELESYKLFQGTMGTSYLYLVPYGDERCLLKLAEVAVLLDETDLRGGFYDKMVKELLDRRLPHFVLDDFKWQMTRNQFSIGWNDGYASMESPDIMLRALGRVVSKMRCHLAYINEAPNVNFERVDRKRRICHLSRVDEKVLRGVGLVMNQLGSDSLDEVSDVRVWENSSRPGYHTRAHSVISTFLKEFVGRRLVVIEENLAQRLVRQNERVGQFGASRILRSIGRNMYAEERAVQDSLLRKLSLVRRLSAIVKGLRSYSFLSASCEELTVFDVEVNEFGANDAYRQLYCIILEFSRARFWWIGDKEDGRWRIPKVELSENGESRLQLKYSIVYEHWCFARLVSAMGGLGYKCKENQLLMGDDSCSVVFSNGVLEVKIIHGVTAWARKWLSQKKISSEFVYTGERAKKKTPDFAVLIRRVADGCSVWVVADAKSDATLKRHIVERRIEYAADIEWTKKRPIASVIFLSGEAAGKTSGIDFPPPPLRDRRIVDEDGEDLFDDHSKDDYRWMPEGGIVEGGDGVCPYHGHVRANVVSDKLDGSVFRDFVYGVSQTALRLMGKNLC